MLFKEYYKKRTGSRIKEAGLRTCQSTEHEACPSCGEGMGDYYEEDKYYLIIRSTGLFTGCL